MLLNLKIPIGDMIRRLYLPIGTAVIMSGSVMLFKQFTGAPAWGNLILLLFIALLSIILSIYIISRERFLEILRSVNVKWNV